MPNINLRAHLAGSTSKNRGRDRLLLGVAVAFNIALRRLQTGLTGQLLNVAKRSTRLATPVTKVRPAAMARAHVGLAFVPEGAPMGRPS